MSNQKGETDETDVTEKCTLSASALGYIKNEINAYAVHTTQFREM